MRYFILTTILITFSYSNGYSQIAGEDEPSILFEASFVGDILFNYAGGMETGNSHMGMIDLASTIDFEGIGLWPGGELLIHIENTHGATPTGDMIGDLQVVSNIENGNYTYLYELLYRQSFSHFDIIVGKQDLNKDFFISEYAGEYINSSFGIMPTASLNAPVAIFPKTALAAAVMVDVSDKFAFQAAVYDGNPLDLDSDPENTNFRISADEGFMTFGELHVRPNIYGLPGTYKFGIFKHSDKFDDIVDSEKSYKGNTGVYFIADQLVYNENNSLDQGLGLFFKFGYTPDSKNVNDIFLGFGANYYGLFSNRESDILGVAVARASVSNYLVESNPEIILPHETVIEMIYSAPVHPNVTVKPDIQYIINTGANASLSNALISIIRFEISF